MNTEDNLQEKSSKYKELKEKQLSGIGVNKSETLRFTQGDKEENIVILTSMLFASKNLHQSKGLKDPLRTTPKNDKRQRRDPSAIVLACGKEKPVLILFQGLISFTQLFSLKFKGVPKE